MIWQRVGVLCAGLSDTPDLRVLLENAGKATELESLASAVRAGADPDAVHELLDSLDQAAAAEGLDGVTTGDRRFQILPGRSYGFPTTYTWQCPHPHQCGRVQPPTEPAAPICALTGDRLSNVPVRTG